MKKRYFPSEVEKLFAETNISDNNTDEDEDN